MTLTSPAVTTEIRPAAEVPATLTEPAPKTLSFLDQVGLWSSMGFTLLGFSGAIYVLDPLGDRRLSLLAALVAIAVGTAVGTLAIACTAAAGARTGAPAMVLLRGLVGGRLSYLPTAANILQCIGWGTFEIVTISTAAHQIAGDVPKWAWVLLAGALTIAMTIRPLGAIRVLRRYALVLVALVMVYLFVQLLREPLPALTDGTWSGFWIAVDPTVAVAVSFVPLAADYSRHARSTRSAFSGACIGFGLGQAACYVLGLIALLTVAKTPDEVAGAFIAVPLGTACFAVLAARELDLAFADVYSTAVSIQNVRPRWDRRVLAIGIGVVTTVLGLVLGIRHYPDFLYLLGSVFVPLTATLLVDFYVVSRGRWDLSESAPTRLRNLVPWVLGFCTYQLINPGTLDGWRSLWTSIADGIGFTPQTWMSASLSALVVSAVATLLVGLPSLLRREP